VVIGAGTTEQLDSAGVAGAALPALGEVGETLWEAVPGGQPVVLTRRGHPVAVVIDLDTFAEYEAALATAEETSTPPAAA
jgi:prevent-host-death family protein